jgi:hypothetical protein
MSNYAESRIFLDFIYSTSRSCVVIPGVSSSSINPSSSKFLLFVNKQLLTGLADARLLPINFYSSPFPICYTVSTTVHDFRSESISNKIHSISSITPPSNCVHSILVSKCRYARHAHYTLVVCFQSLFSYIISSYLFMIVKYVYVRFALSFLSQQAASWTLQVVS